MHALLRPCQQLSRSSVAENEEIDCGYLINCLRSHSTSSRLIRALQMDWYYNQNTEWIGNCSYRTRPSAFQFVDQIGKANFSAVLLGQLNSNNNILFRTLHYSVSKGITLYHTVVMQIDRLRKLKWIGLALLFLIPATYIIIAQYYRVCVRVQGYRLRDSYQLRKGPIFIYILRAYLKIKTFDVRGQFETPYYACRLLPAAQTPRPILLRKHVHGALCRDDIPEWPMGNCAWWALAKRA